MAWAGEQEHLSNQSSRSRDVEEALVCSSRRRRTFQSKVHLHQAHALAPAGRQLQTRVTPHPFLAADNFSKDATVGSHGITSREFITNCMPTNSINGGRGSCVEFMIHIHGMFLPLAPLHSVITVTRLDALADYRLLIEPRISISSLNVTFEREHRSLSLEGGRWGRKGHVWDVEGGLDLIERRRLHGRHETRPQGADSPGSRRANEHR